MLLIRGQAVETGPREHPTRSRAAHPKGGEVYKSRAPPSISIRSAGGAAGSWWPPFACRESAHVPLLAYTGIWGYCGKRQVRRLPRGGPQRRCGPPQDPSRCQRTGSTASPLSALP
jgi:hypothetical protein